MCHTGAKVDLDGNGLINFAEFVTMMRKCKVDTDFDRQIREAFKVWCGVVWYITIASIAYHNVSFMLQSCAASLHPVVQVTSFFFAYRMT